MHWLFQSSDGRCEVGSVCDDGLFIVVQSSCVWLKPRDLQHAGLPCPSLSPGWDSAGKNTGVGCHALLQGVFLTQGSNPSLPNRQVDSSPSELRGKPHACHLLKLKVAGKVPGHSWLLTGREHSSPHPLQITAKYQLQTEIYFNYGIKIGTIKTSHPWKASCRCWEDRIKSCLPHKSQ